MSVAFGWDLTPADSCARSSVLLYVGFEAENKLAWKEQSSSSVLQCRKTMGVVRFSRKLGSKESLRQRYIRERKHHKKRLSVFLNITQACICTDSRCHSETLHHSFSKQTLQYNTPRIMKPPMAKIKYLAIDRRRIFRHDAARE